MQVLRVGAQDYNPINDGTLRAAELDEGLIVQQNVARVTQRNSFADVVRKGRDLERMVLAITPLAYPIGGLTAKGVLIFYPLLPP